MHGVGIATRSPWSDADMAAPKCRSSAVVAHTLSASSASIRAWGKTVPGKVRQGKVQQGKVQAG